MLFLQMASSSLDASAKIYAGRVDAVHQETYKVLTGLGRSDKENGEGSAGIDSDGDVDENGDRMTKAAKIRAKRAVVMKPVVATNLSKIRAKVKASDADVSYDCFIVHHRMYSKYAVCNTRVKTRFYRLT